MQESVVGREVRHEEGKHKQCTDLEARKNRGVPLLQEMNTHKDVPAEGTRYKLEGSAAITVFQRTHEKIEF